MTQVFISYKRNVRPDEDVARMLYERIRAIGHSVFIDKRMAPGTRWAERIEQEIATSEWLIILLSSESVDSEMVRAEIETARRCAEEGGCPRILPLRVRYGSALPYPLSAYLDGIQWAAWDGEHDDEELVHQIIAALGGADLSLMPRPPLTVRDSTSTRPPDASVAPVTLESPDVAAAATSRFYIERPSDREAAAAVTTESATTLTIRGPKQMGKTTLLNRLVHAAHESSKDTAIIDFKLFTGKDLQEPGRLFQQFVASVADELDMDFELDRRWERLPPARACTRTMQKMMKELGKPLVLCADELERLFESPAQNEFLGMLRSWHEARAIRAEFGALTMVLVTSTDPDTFMQDTEAHGSPFNVGIRIHLDDFGDREVMALADRHGVALSEVELDRMLKWFGGHPYLTRRALYLIAKRKWEIRPNQRIEEVADPTGPFGDHMRQYLLQLRSSPVLLRELRRAIAGRPCSDTLTFARLNGAGLLRGTADAPQPRCELYGSFFSSSLDL